MTVRWRKMKAEREGRLHLSVAEVAELAGLSERAYRDIEAGRVGKVHAETARGLGRAFGVDPACIAGFKKWL